MKKSSRWAPVTCLALALALGLVVAACNDAHSPTAPPPPAENVAAAPGSASLAAGEPEGEPEAGQDPGLTDQRVPVEETQKRGRSKVDVCHQKGNGGYHIINVAESAVPAHESHGDWLVSEEVCDGTDNNCDGEVDEGGVCCSEIRVRDDFDSQSFGNSDGPDDWSGDWVENDGADGGAGPVAGNVQIAGGALRLSDNPDTGTQPSAARQVDLAGTTHAILMFSFETSSGVDSNDAIAVEASADGGGSWTPLETINGLVGETSGNRAIDISTYTSASTQIRFRVSNNYGGTNEYFFVNYVEVSSDCA